MDSLKQTKEDGRAGINYQFIVTQWLPFCKQSACLQRCITALGRLLTSTLYGVITQQLIGMLERTFHDINFIICVVLTGWQTYLWSFCSAPCCLFWTFLYSSLSIYWPHGVVSRSWSTEYLLNCSFLTALSLASGWCFNRSLMRYQVVQRITCTRIN